MSRLSAARLMTHFYVIVSETASESSRKELRGLNFSNHSSPPVTPARQWKSESSSMGSAQMFVLLLESRSMKEIHGLRSFLTAEVFVYSTLRS